MRLLIASILLLNLLEIYESITVRTDSSRILINRYKPKPIDTEDAEVSKRNHVRNKRFLGLNKNIKFNKQYQECIGPGDVKGHCKHVGYCPINILRDSKQSREYQCFIENTFVGVCCPDDLALNDSIGSQLIKDLPAGGKEYDESGNISGCGLPIDGGSIIKTKITTIQEWPWLVALYRRDNLAEGYEKQFCGGSVITDSHILTAAHCINRLTPEEIRVRLSEYDFSNPLAIRFRDYEAAKLISHEYYTAGFHDNDIGIVRLIQPTTFNPYIRPICLPPTGLNYENNLGIITGWDSTYFGGPEILLQVAIPIWNLKKCDNALFPNITDSYLCAAAYQRGKDSCQGDSGGPLMYQLKNKRWVIAGIVSWGVGCGNNDTPAIYIRVDKYLPWIIQNTIAKKIN